MTKLISFEDKERQEEGGLKLLLSFGLDFLGSFMGNCRDQPERVKLQLFIF